MYLVKECYESSRSGEIINFIGYLLECFELWLMLILLLFSYPNAEDRKAGACKERNHFNLNSSLFLYLMI